MGIDLKNRLRDEQDLIFNLLGDGNEATVEDLALASGLSNARVSLILSHLSRAQRIHSRTTAGGVRLYWSTERPCDTAGPVRKGLGALALLILLGVAVAACVAALLGCRRGG